MGKDKKRRFGSAKENAEKRNSGANYGYIRIPKDVKMFTPEADTTALIDILPYEVTDVNHLDKIDEGVMWYKRPFKVHKSVGVNDDSFVCPTTFSKPCPICEHGQELKKDSDADEALIEKTKAKWRNLYAVRVLEYDGKKKFDKDTIHLFDFSDWLFQEVFENQLKKKDEFDTFFLHDEGCSLEITFDEGSFGGNKFPKVTRVDFVKRKKQYKDDILDKVPNLDEDALIVLSYDELEAKFFGDAGVDADDKKEDKKKDKKSKESDNDESEPKKKEKNKKASEETSTSGTKKAGKKDPSIEELINEADSVEDLLEIANEHSDTFGEFKKELKKIEKTKKLKARMLEIVSEASPFKEDAEEEKEEKKEKKKDKKKDADECPYNHKFGKDTDKYDDCDDCDLWNECKKAKKEAKKNKG